MKKFTTFDINLVDFFNSKGIKYENSFKGRNGDDGFDYGYVPNLKALLAEFDYVKSAIDIKEDEERKQASFEKMISKFLKSSKEKFNDGKREHTKADRKRNKAENSKRRKISLAK